MGNSQDLSKLLGKILRIDVEGTNGPDGVYGIPADNPFVGQGQAGVRKEIFAYGLRNPWRASFDDGPGGSGRFFVADVGQGEIEEINIAQAGGNYGWRIKEGTQDFDNSVIPQPVVPLLDPIARYAHPTSGRMSPAATRLASTFRRSARTKPARSIWRRAARWPSVRSTRRLVFRRVPSIVLLWCRSHRGASYWVADCWCC